MNIYSNSDNTTRSRSLEEKASVKSLTHNSRLQLINASTHSEQHSSNYLHASNLTQTRMLSRNHHLAPLTILPIPIRQPPCVHHHHISPQPFDFSISPSAPTLSTPLNPSSFVARMDLGQFSPVVTLLTPDMSAFLAFLRH